MWLLGFCLDEVKGLQRAAEDCESAASVIHALQCLEEHREFLPKTLIPILGPYGCQALEGEGLHLAEEAGKDAVRASLTKLSHKMVEEILHKGSSTALATQQLSQLCRSTELNAKLSCDLEREYILKPMSAKLAPSQSDIDNLAAMLEASLSDDWHAQLLSINERIKAAGEHGSRVLDAVNLKLDGFSAAASKRISKSKQVVADALKKLLAPKCNQEVYERSWAALSLNGELADENQETDSHRDVVEEAEAAIGELELLLPVDMLLKLMMPSLGVATETVAVAMQCIVWALNKSLKDGLKKAQRAQNKALIPTASLGQEIMRAMRVLKALTSLADTLLKALQCLEDTSSLSLADKLSALKKEADDVVDVLVKKELDEWEQADTKLNGWLDLFDRHLQVAYRLQSLDNRQLHVKDAFVRLYTKVKVWRKTCYSEAVEALKAHSGMEDAGAWQRFVKSCVNDGLAFEQSVLFQELNFQAQFRPLVETQTEICQQEAASAQQNVKLVTWQKLTTLISALQQLQSTDPRVAKLVTRLMESREPLSTALEDDESRFTKALSEGRFSQASQLLKKAQCCSVLKCHASNLR